MNPPTPAVTSLVENPYRCEGKVDCSEMTSCAEALFYLKNCPNPKMVGDNEGLPSESQWCQTQ